MLHLGRKDNQLKLHGQRIELTAIENVMSQNGPSVTVCLLKLPGEVTQLVAFFRLDTSPSKSSFEEPEVILSQKAEIISLQMRSRATRVLPSYMVPKANVALTCLPLTANGKVDRVTLTKCYIEKFLPLQAEALVVQIVEPTTLLERSIHAVVSEMFNLSQLSIETDLFTLVLDSLSCMRLASTLRRKLKLPVNLQCIMENRTVRDLAGKLSSHVTNQNDKRAITDVSIMIHFSSLPNAAVPTVFCYTHHRDYSSNTGTSFSTCAR